MACLRQLVEISIEIILEARDLLQRADVRKELGVNRFGQLAQRMIGDIFRISLMFGVMDEMNSTVQVTVHQNRQF